MARIFDTLLSEPSGFRPSQCAKIFLNSDCSSSCEEIYVIRDKMPEILCPSNFIECSACGWHRGWDPCV